jgi:hypothetical protein
LTITTLVPIIGSGFSGGMKTPKGQVPTGTQMKNYMLDTIIEVKPEFTKEQLSTMEFSWVAQRFFEYVDSEKIEKYFRQFFVNINFQNNAKWNFINRIGWKYIYTLNIDTAIEDSSRNWEVFYPNSDFINESVYEKRKLFKVHGDVNQFFKTREKNTLILSQQQYINSLKENKKFQDLLISDYKGKNILYIGCSLDDELDLKYSAISDTNLNQPINLTKIIYVTTDIQHP